jgi:hypothetical protein
MKGLNKIRGKIGTTGSFFSMYVFTIAIVIVLILFVLGSGIIRKIDSSQAGLKVYRETDTGLSNLNSYMKNNFRNSIEIRKNLEGGASPDEAIKMISSESEIFLKSLVFEFQDGTLTPNRYYKWRDGRWKMSTSRTREGLYRYVDTVSGARYNELNDMNKRIVDEMKSNDFYAGLKALFREARDNMNSGVTIYKEREDYIYKNYKSSDEIVRDLDFESWSSYSWLVNDIVERSENEK